MRKAPFFFKRLVRDTSLGIHRWPTKDYIGDAVNQDPDYSCAYVTLNTNTAIQGHGLTFTIGRGNELVVAAVKALSYRVEGRSLGELTRDMGAFWRDITSDSQLRWVGPEKGVIHLATGAIVNAVWDLWGKYEQKPVWKLVADMSPEEILKLIDFTYITDAITPEEALELLRKAKEGKQGRIRDLMENGYPCYTTSAGWIGYSDERMVELLQEAFNKGIRHMKLKVGLSREDDVRRLRLARKTLGPEVKLMIDANQR